MKVILLSGGSLGDTMPFALVGKAMRERGHDVTLVATGNYAHVAAEMGLDFRPSMSEESFSRFIAAQHDVDLLEKVRLSALAINEAIEPSYQAIAELHRPGETVLCSQGFMVAGRIAQESLGCPTATAHVYPAGFRSIDMAPPFHRLPKLLRRWSLGLIDQVMYKDVKPVVERKRLALGLPKDPRPLRVWWTSPQLELGLFPDWFQAPQHDWPKQTVLTGFPLAPTTPNATLPATMEDFLKRGGPTIVFAPSSLTRATREFFREAVELARQMNSQAIFLTSQPELLPNPLPDFAYVHPFAPLDVLLPRCRAIVHQGGIGITAQALRAGLPQLTCPIAYDQPDNAFRLERLGTSLNVPPKAFLARAIAPRFQALCESPETQRRCRDLADRVHRSRAIDAWADELERLAHRP